MREARHTCVHETDEGSASELGMQLRGHQTGHQVIMTSVILTTLKLCTARHVFDKLCKCSECSTLLIRFAEVRTTQ